MTLRARLGRWDRALLAAATARRSPVSDRVMTTASTVANRSMLWLACAGVLAATGRRRPRSAAASGLLGVGIAATLVNGPLKFIWRRHRPPVDVTPLLPLPHTFSFPSGHSASAAAFATGVSVTLPAAAPVVVPMAATVAYSRVHTGVHYPSDVAVGIVVGAASGLAAAAIVDRARASSLHQLEVPSLDVAVPTRAVVLASPNSGAASELGAALDALGDAGITLERTIDVGDSAALRKRVDAGGPLLVIAAGGDGTVGTAAGAVTGTDAVLLTLPLGTSNDVSRSIGWPPDAVETVRGLRSARVCSVDVGTASIGDADPKVFVNATTVGLNVAFAALATDHGLRDRFGGLTYPIAAARAVRSYEPFECVIERDDGRTERCLVVHLSVSNAPVFGGVLGMRVPRASMTDGLLDVIIIERLSITRLALAVGGTLVGRHKPVHRVHTMRVRSLRVSGPRDEDVAVDGEVRGALPVSFAVQPGALRVVAPPLA